MPRLSPEEMEGRKSQAVELAVSTFEALAVERGESGKIWASMLKEAMKRRKPDFNESHFGFRSFGNLLEEAQARGLLEVGRDEKSGAFVSRNSINTGRFETPIAPSEETSSASDEPKSAEAPTAEEPAALPKRRSRGRGKGAGKDATRAPEPETVASTAVEAPVPAADPVGIREIAPVVPAASAADSLPESSNEPVALPAGAPESEAAPQKRAASRGRRPRKPKVVPPVE